MKYGEAGVARNSVKIPKVAVVWLSLLLHVRDRFKASLFNYQ
jgi:hypothetical protein